MIRCWENFEEHCFGYITNNDDEEDDDDELLLWYSWPTKGV